MSIGTLRQLDRTQTDGPRQRTGETYGRKEGRALALSLEGFLDLMMMEYQIPGLAVAVAAPERPPFLHCVGWRDVEQQLPMTPDTIVGYGSITKAVTAAALLQLTESGRIDLMAPIGRWIPELGHWMGDLTPHHLLTHTGGLPPLPLLTRAMAHAGAGNPEGEARGEELQQGSPINNVGELVEALNEDPPKRLGIPGTQFSYSNEGYALLGLMVERMSGRSYQEYVTRNILQPLEMDSARFTPPTAPGPGATLYALPDEEPGGIRYRMPGWQAAPAEVAAGFLNGSIRDLLRWAEVFSSEAGPLTVGPRILSAESLRRMTVAHVPLPTGQGYGYGVFLTPYHGFNLVEHGGSLKGISAWFSTVPTRNLSVAVLANLGGVPAGQVALAGLNRELGFPVDGRRPLPPRQSVATETIASWVGRYCSGEGTDIEVKMAGDHVRFVIRGRAYEAWPSGQDAVRVRIQTEESVARFIRDSSGGVVQLFFGWRLLTRKSPAPRATGTGG